MPYEPSPVSDDGQKSISSSGNQAARRDEPRGIARYLQPLTKAAQVQPRQHAPVLARPVSFSRPDATPAKPSLLQTPSRIAVVINSSSQHKTLQPPSRDASEDSIDVLVTSDITPRRRPGPSTLLGPSTTPAKPPPTTTTPLGKPRSTVPRAAAPTTTTTTAPTQTQTPATQPPKRRGRPVGWRPGMGSYSSQPATSPGGTPVPKPTPKQQQQRTGGGGAPKKRGRPPGRPAGANPPRAIFERLAVAYVPFRCEWAGCPAELQNLDTLRRHVAVVHGREGACRWGRCDHQMLPMPGGTGTGTGFASSGGMGEFERHVEERHLLPCAWHVGDGPRNAVVEYRVRTPDEEADDLPGYLFDDEGNQVTPSVLHQEFENDEERKERRRRLHRLLLERDRNAPAQEPGSEDEADLVLE